MHPQTMRKLATALAVVSAVAAMAFAMMFIRRAPAADQPTQQVQREVVVASAPVQAKEYLSAESGKFRLVKLDADRVSDDMLTSLSELDGKVAIQSLEPNKPLTRKHVVSRNELQELAPHIPHGTVAITIQTDKFSAVNGFIKPYDRVDVLATMDAGGTRTVTKVILQNILVLAINSMGPMTRIAAQGGEPQAVEAPSTVTLALPLDQAQKVSLAEAKGKLRLVLRSAGSMSHVSVPPISSDQWLPKPSEGGESRPATQPTRMAQAPPRRTRGSIGGGLYGPPTTGYGSPGVLPPGTPWALSPGGIEPRGGSGPQPGGGTFVRQTPEHQITIIRGEQQSTVTFKQ